MAANPPDVHNLLHQAMDALTRGDKPLARDLLTSVLEMDDRNEQAWLWLSGAVDSPHEQRICLENVLTINPGSTAARQGLAYLEKQEAEHPTPSPVPAPTPPQPAMAAPAAPPPQPAIAAPALTVAPAPPSVAPGAGYPAPQEAPAPAPVAPNWPAALPPEWTSGPAGPPPGWSSGPPASNEAPAPAAPAIPAGWGTGPAAAAGSPLADLPEWDSAATGGTVPGWDRPAPAPAWAGAPPAAQPPTPSNNADPWAALRADLSAPAAPATSPAPAGNGGMLGAAANSSWMDAFGSGPSAPLAPPGPWTAGGSAAGGGADNLGVKPFVFDSTGGAGPAADNPWSEVEAAVPGLAGFDMGAPSGGEVSLPPDLSRGTAGGGTVLPSDSPWADTFGAGALGHLAEPAADEPFLQVRQPDAGHPMHGRDNPRGSSPALIARPPIGGRSSTPVPTIPCPSCGEMVTDNALSCPRCQYRFYAPCPHCGDYIDTSDPNPRGHDVCPHCQQPVDKKALGQAPARGATGRPGAPSTTPPTVMVAPTPKNKKKTKSPREDKQAAAVAAAAWTPNPVEAPPRSNTAGRILALIVVLAVLGFVIFVLPHMMPTLLNAELTPTP